MHIKGHSLIEKFIFFSISCVILLWVMGLDRNFLPDQQDYLIYFRADFLNNFIQQYQQQPWILKITSLFSSEVLWLGYTQILVQFFSAKTCVLLTVFILNFLLLMSCYECEKPLLALFLWVISPAGFLIMGFVQIRQGFAFAIFLFMALKYQRPLLAAIITAMIHTTFAIPLIFLIIHHFVKNKRNFFLVSFIFSVLIAFLLAHFFHEIAGRRADTYSVLQGPQSILYFFVWLAWAIPSLYMFFSKKEESFFSYVYLGMLLWFIACYFLFPVGNNRVTYYIWLLLIPLLANDWAEIFAIKVYFYFCLLLLMCLFLYLYMVSNGEYYHTILNASSAWGW